LKPPKAYLVLVACLAATLTACAATTPRHTGAAALTGAHSRVRHAHTRADCPPGRLLPPGEAIAIDYVDFLQFGGRMYIASAGPIKPSQLEHVITHVRCSLVAEEDPRRAEPPVTNRTASFLAAGSAVYQVRGYPPSCRLAAYVHGRLQVYLAQTTVHHHTAPVPCALHLASGGHPR
jgi:hypothetical protein